MMRHAVLLLSLQPGGLWKRGLSVGYTVAQGTCKHHQTTRENYFFFFLLTATGAVEYQPVTIPRPPFPSIQASKQASSWGGDSIRGNLRRAMHPFSPYNYHLPPSDRSRGRRIGYFFFFLARCECGVVRLCEA